MSCSRATLAPYFLHVTFDSIFLLVFHTRLGCPRWSLLHFFACKAGPSYTVFLGNGRHASVRLVYVGDALFLGKKCWRTTEWFTSRTPWCATVRIESFVQYSRSTRPAIVHCVVILYLCMVIKRHWRRARIWCKVSVSWAFTNGVAAKRNKWQNGSNNKFRQAFHAWIVRIFNAPTNGSSSSSYT